MDQKAVTGDEISVAMYERFGWGLVSSPVRQLKYDNLPFQLPDNFPESVQQAVAEASAEVKDKNRLADKELSQVEKTDGNEMRFGPNEAPPMIGWIFTLAFDSLV